MSNLLVLIKKELKETVRNPRFIIFTIILPLILYPLMGLIISQAFTSVSEKTKTGTILVVDMDNSNISEYLINSLNRSGLHVILKHSEPNISSLDSNVLGVIIIPKNFGEDFLNGARPTVTVYSVINGVSISEQGLMSYIFGVVGFMKEALKYLLAQMNGIDPNLISNPFTENRKIYVRNWGKLMTDQDLNAIFTQVMFWPWIMFSMVISVVQLSATFLGEEKEQKTLEILLTFPVRRTTILFSKVVGSGILAVLAAIFYTVGFLIYMNSFSTMIGQIGLTIQLSFDPVSIILTGLIFFLALLFSAALGLTVSVIAQDTKSAESLATAVIMPTMLVAFIVMFMDISSLPTYLQLILYAFPYTYLMQGLKYVYIGRYQFFIVGIIDNLVAAILMLSLISRIFTSERILTMKIRFGRSRRSRLT